MINGRLVDFTSDELNTLSLALSELGAKLKILPSQSRDLDDNDRGYFDILYQMGKEFSRVESSFFIALIIK